MDMTVIIKEIKLKVPGRKRAERPEEHGLN